MRTRARNHIQPLDKKHTHTHTPTYVPAFLGPIEKQQQKWTSGREGGKAGRQVGLGYHAGRATEKQISWEAAGLASALSLTMEGACGLDAE